MLAQSTELAGDDLSCDHVPIKVTGAVRLQPASISTDEHLRVELELHSQDSTLADLVQVDRTEGQLSIKVPGSIQASEASDHGLYISVTIIASVSSKATFKSFAIRVTALDVEFLRALPMLASASTSITSSSGNVRALGPSPLSRRTSIHLISGSIYGVYDLLDLLSLRTVSGAIDVGVTPQPASPTEPAPAEFVAESTSGRINVDLPANVIIGHLPARDYRVRVRNTSGSISGRYVLGSQAAFRGGSGSISTTLLPVHAVDCPSTVSSRTVSGAVDIHVLSPLHARGVPMKVLSGDHRSTSGRISVLYPREWEGEIHAHSVSGHINVRGEAVKVIQETPGRVLARKGDGAGRVACYSVSGAVDVEVR